MGWLCNRFGPFTFFTLRPLFKKIKNKKSSSIKLKNLHRIPWGYLCVKMWRMKNTNVLRECTTVHHPWSEWENVILKVYRADGQPLSPEDRYFSVAEGVLMKVRYCFSCFISIGLNLFSLLSVLSVFCATFSLAFLSSLLSTSLFLFLDAGP